MQQSKTKPTFAEFLTVAEAAGVLGVSPWTLRNWDRAGKLKPIRHPVNGYRIYRQQDLEAVLQADNLLGKRKETLAPRFAWNEIGEREHFVQFYENDRYLVESVSGYLGRALAGGEAAVIIATQAHRHRIQKKLRARGVDVSAARARGQYVVLGAAETLAMLVVDGLPDARRFADVVGGVIQRLEQGWPRVRAFGEMVALLWAEGNRAGARRLEELWNELAKTHAFSLFCAYPLSGFREEPDGAPFQEICTCHARVIPAESYTGLSTAAEQLRAISALQQKAEALEEEIASRTSAERDRALLAAIVESSDDAIVSKTLNGTIQSWNGAAERLFGYTAQEAVGRPITMIIPPERLEEEREILSRLVRGERIEHFETVRVSKDGKRINISLTVSPVRDRAGTIIGASKVARDITERIRIEKALRDSEQRFARFMERLPGLAWIKNAEGRYVYVNEAALKAFNIARQDLYGKTDEEIFPPETAAQFKENDRRASASGPGVQVIESLTHGDGSVHYSVVSKFPIPSPDGGLDFVGGMAIDVTDRMRAEEALREADRRKDEFLATLAHELRNPLAPIRNSLHILRMADDAAPAAKRVHEMMERQVLHLVRLVDDLLEVSRISRGKIDLHKERLELASIINNAVETSKPFIEAGGHELEVAVPPAHLAVHGDRVRLAQVFANLLNNSAKYTDRGGKICISARREEGQVVVSVRDTGIGIPRDMLARVFDMFAQVDRKLRRSQDGLGIGLSLVRTLVSMHGGSVAAHSEGPGQGSEFVVRLPLGEASGVSGGAAQLSDVSKPAARPARRILVVDDHRDAADSLAMLLKFLGADVQVVYDGASALDALRICRPSVLLVDLSMPGMDGYAVAQQVRRDREFDDVMLIALTGWGQEEDRRRSKEAGFDHHLVKPVDFGALEALLDSLESKAAAQPRASRSD